MGCSDEIETRTQGGDCPVLLRRVFHKRDCRHCESERGNCKVKTFKSETAAKGMDRLTDGAKKEERKG